MMFKVSRVETKPIDGQKPGSSGLRKKRLLQQQLTQYPTSEELSVGKIKFKAFDLGGHQIAHRVWKDYYAKVGLYQRGDQFVLTAFNKGLNTWASWVDQNVNPSKTYKVDEFESYYASKPKLEAAFFFKTSCNSKRCL